MTFDEVMKILEVALPVAATLVAARVTNRNSAHWTAWTGGAGRVIGLLVSLLDVFRSPADYKASLVPPKKKKAGKK